MCQLHIISTVEPQLKSEFTELQAVAQLILFAQSCEPKSELQEKNQEKVDDIQ